MGWRLGLPHSFGRHNSTHSSWLSGFQLLEFRDPDPRMRKLCWAIFTEALWENVKEREDSLCPSELGIKVQTWFSFFKNTEMLTCDNKIHASEYGFVATALGGLIKRTWPQKPS